MAEAFLWDRFREVESLGEGGMGLVVKAEDLGLERQVAIKRLRPETSGDPEIRQRFLQEARATGQLEHPNIPPIYEMGCDEKDNPYFALKLVRGQTLAEIIAKLAEPDAKTHERYSFIERLQIFLKACEAVAYAHKRGVFHRDIKPENLMVGEFGEVFVMDWGLAKEESRDAAYQTEAGAFFGTPMYAAPEVLSGEPASERSEVYSLGATLYHWLTIRPPFEGDNLRAILTNVLTGKLKDPVLLSPPIQGRMPVEMSRLILKAMQSEPNKRFASVNDMIAEIKEIIEGDIHPICPCTTVKYSFFSVSRLIDRHPIFVLPVIFWLLYPLYALVQWFLSR